MWMVLLYGLLVGAANVFIHAVGTYSNLSWILPTLRKHPTLPFARAWWLLLGIVGVLLSLHAVEVALWAELYVALHTFPNTETAYYYSLVTYTTLGYGDVLLPRTWRLLGGMESMIGVLMFGWSTAGLAAFLHYVQEARIRTLFGTSAAEDAVTAG